MNKYDAILLDPAWHYPGSKNNMGAAENHYSVMSYEQIYDMPIKDYVAETGAYVFVWATSAWIHKQIECYKHWGLTYRGIAFVWVKTRKDGEVRGAMGVPPTFTKPNAEYLLVGTTCKKGRPYKLSSFKEPQIIMAPATRHSEKPELFQDAIERVIGSDKRKLELFARRSRDDWDCTGLELTGHDYTTGQLA